MASRKPTESGWSRWRRQRRLSQESQRLLKEGRKLFKRHRDALKPEGAAEVEGALQALEAARAEGRGLQRRLDELDRALDTHLAFARKSAAREYTESIGVAVLVALLLRAFVVEAFKIPSGSMIPTLEVGDHIVVNKFIHGLRVPLTNIKLVKVTQPDRGEIIVFVYPKDESKDFIKRVVAVGGDTIEIRQNQIFVNGKAVPRRRLPGPCTYTDEEEGSDRWHPKRCLAFEEEAGGTRYRVIQDIHAVPMDRPPEKVAEGQVFVMGDNRDNSHDSRFWGTVPDSHIKGRAMVIWWSSGDPEGVRWSRFFQRVHATPEPVPPRSGL